MHNREKACTSVGMACTARKDTRKCGDGAYGMDGAHMEEKRACNTEEGRTRDGRARTVRKARGGHVYNTSLIRCKDHSFSISTNFEETNQVPKLE